MAQDVDPAAIECTSDGPLLVRGGAALHGPHGEELPLQRVTALCRCGASSRKPYCDGSHKRIGWTSARQSVQPLDRYRDYSAGPVTVQDNRAICAHAAACVHGLPAVFDIERRPWIDAAGASADRVADLVRRCPSGALRMLVDGKPVAEPPAPAVITLARDGPYEVRGPVALKTETGLRPPVAERYTLCRCGASGNKPFCDGSHAAVQFRDPVD